MAGWQPIVTRHDHDHEHDHANDSDGLGSESLNFTSLLRLEPESLSHGSDRLSLKPPLRLSLSCPCPSSGAFRPR